MNQEVIVRGSESIENSAWIRKAIWLSWFTIIYNSIEGVVSIAFGLTDDSFALFGFGADSFIEVFSALLVLWRFKGETGNQVEHSLTREKRATFGIGLLFFLLGMGTVIGSVLQLTRGDHPQTTFPGLIVSAISLSFMFFLWRAKQKVGAALESSTVLKDADCSLACIKLSAILFVGSLAFIVVPSFWWADSMAAILLGCLILHEGWETIQATRKSDFSGGCCGTD